MVKQNKGLELCKKLFFSVLHKIGAKEPNLIVWKGKQNCSSILFFRGITSSMTTLTWLQLSINNVDMC